MAQKTPLLITKNEFETYFAHCCRYRNKEDENKWPHDTYIIYKYTIWRGKNQSEEQPWVLVKRTDKGHAEDMMLERLSELNKKTLAEADKMDLRVYLSYSPCSACAEKLLNFKRDWKNLIKDIDIELTFSNMFNIKWDEKSKEENVIYFYPDGKGHADGLVKLHREGVKLSIFDGDSDWEIFLEVIGMPEENDHSEDFVFGDTDTRQENENDYKQCVVDEVDDLQKEIEKIKLSEGEDVGAVGGKKTEREEWLDIVRQDNRRKREAVDRQALEQIKNCTRRYTTTKDTVTKAGQAGR